MQQDPGSVPPDAEATAALSNEPVVRHLGLTDYVVAWNAMRSFAEQRTPADADEIWLLQHPPVYTLGFNAKHGPFPVPHGVALVQTDRGGDITYHGPGQLVAYVLCDIRRRGWGPKGLVNALEQSVIDTLTGYAIASSRRAGAPGVYVGDRKIAQLGLRIRHGTSYHGVSLNVDMDLGPFDRIDPCGYPGLEVTQMAEFVSRPDIEAVEKALLDALMGNLGYNARHHAPETRNG